MPNYELIDIALLSYVVFIKTHKTSMGFSFSSLLYAVA